MSLAAGSRLGPYEVLSALGAGGMGEVYRARDTRLNREVAVKVLPESLAEDPDRLRRFTLEAQSAGGLNHPHILAIHDVGTQGGTPFLVSELLEGESLRSRLRGGKLSTSKAIEFARQAAAGLAAAHAKGIVHRDIKPENLFVTREGQIKILDFGLAKMKPAITAEEATHAETETVATGPGIALGTVGYMSPEQVRGDPVDHRSDIFSFGCVLYEMLTGQRAFQGATAVETMHAILKNEPPEGAIPPGLERIVTHCLEKDAAARFQSAGDLAFDLAALSQSTQRAAVPMGKGHLRLRKWWAAVVGVAVLAAGLAGGYFAGARREQSAPPEFQRLTFRRGHIPTARFTPDGNGVVYGATWEGDPHGVFSIRLDSPEYHQPVIADGLPLAISPQGELAALLRPKMLSVWRQMGTLARLPLSGGAPREVLEAVDWAEWGPNGVLAVVRQGEKRQQLEFPPGKVVFETGGLIQFPRFSPAGDRLAFLHYPRANETAGELNVIDFQGGVKTISRGWLSIWGMAWHPETGEVWFTASRKGAKSDLYAATPQGKVRLVFRQSSNLVLQDISRDGRVLLTSLHWQMRLHFADEAGKVERDLSWLDWSLAHSLSDYGKMVVFSESGEGAGEHYASYYRKTDGSPAVRLGIGGFPSLSPDGKWVAATDVTAEGIVLLPIGPGESRTIPLPGFSVNVPRWRPGSRTVLFSGTESGRGQRIYSLAVDNGGRPQPVTPEGVAPGLAVSPGGRFAAVKEVRTQNSVVYPLDGAAATVCRGVEPDELPTGWSADESEVLVLQRGRLPARVSLVNWRTGERRIWKELSPRDRAGVPGLVALVVTPDRQAYAYSYLQRLAELHLVRGLR